MSRSWFRKNGGSKSGGKNNLLLVVESCKHVNYGEEVALASELEPRCG